LTRVRRWKPRRVADDRVRREADADGRSYPRVSLEWQRQERGGEHGGDVPDWGLSVAREVCSAARAQILEDPAVCVLVYARTALNTHVKVLRP
jgi:hypothetical protein